MPAAGGCRGRMSDKTQTDTGPLTASDRVTLTVSDIGGIEHAEVELPAGVTTLAGANATNRSSLLRALNEVLGGTMGSIRRGADDDTGYAKLTIADDTYVRTLTQRGNDVSRDGEPYTTATAIVDLYVSLLEQNEIRRLIETGEQDAIDNRLADLLMAPIDVDAIQQEIERRQHRSNEIGEQLEEIETAKGELPELQEQREAKKAEIADLEAKIEAKRDRLTDLDINRETAEQAETRLHKLEDLQEDCRNIETTIEYKEGEIEDIEQQLADREDEIADVEQRMGALATPDDDAIQSLKERLQQLRRAAMLLDNLVEGGRTFTNPTHDRRSDLQAALNATDAAGDIIAFNPDSPATACPLCGTSVQRETLHERVDALASVATDCYDAADEIEEERAQLRSRRQQLNELRKERRNLENEIHRLEERIEDTRRHIEELEDTRDTKQSKIGDLQERVAEIREHRSSELETLYDKIAELQDERATAKAELDSIDTQLTDHESLIADETDLREELADIEEAIEARRKRVSRLEESVQEAAATHMEELIEQLEYDRIDGLRLDREPTDDPAGFSDFQLVVVRRQPDSAVSKEGDLTTLSESERSLVGLVVALAGYVAHEVADEVPFLLLDSIEEFDTQRIDRLLTYVRETVDVQHVVTALLPEDAEGVGAEDTEITADTFG